jgi:Chlorite dismutase
MRAARRTAVPTETKCDLTSAHQLARSLGRRGFVGGALVGLASCDGPRGATAGSRGPDRNPRLFTFVGGAAGAWSVVEARAVVGAPLASVARLDIIAGAPAADAPAATWSLRGVTSHERYTVRAEKTLLAAKQAALGRPEATHAALIPIRKNAAWWALTQDERRAVFEDRSNHVKIGLKYLPAIARRLHHCRDLGEAEPFDFVTLFDYTQADAARFEEMVAELRTTEEWKYVDREVDLRLVRANA